MPFVLSKKKDTTRPKLIDIDGETIALQFRPAKLTFAFDKALREMSGPEPEEMLAEKILEVVADWDLESEPGEKVPLTVDALMDVPSEILMAVLRGVRSAGSPPPTPPSSSADFSSVGQE